MHPAVTQIAVPPFACPGQSDRAAQAVLGAVSPPQSAAASDGGAGGGDPFFLEELAWHAIFFLKKKKKKKKNIFIYTVLAARIDRLPPEEKRLFQTAAVLNFEVPFALLRAMVDMPEAVLHRGLTHIQAAEFLYESKILSRTGLCLQACPNA